MLLKGSSIADEIEAGSLCILPGPDLAELRGSGDASIDLRLGRWLLELRHSRAISFETGRTDAPEIANDSDEELPESPFRHITQTYKLSRYHFIPFGRRFVLHPGRFVLGITLEWLALPQSVGGLVTGKSSWGRRGLIIETASGIHPGFSGCLALEITNVGEMPLELPPGIRVCQVFFYRAEGDDVKKSSQFDGRRKPVVGAISEDKVFWALEYPLKRHRK